VTHTTTLVTEVYLSKKEALEALSQLFGRPIDDSDPADAKISLESGAMVTIEVPKFGEDLPLTLDVSSDSPELTEKAVTHIMDSAQTHLTWSLTIVGQ